MRRTGYALLIGILATLRLHALARRVELRYARRRIAIGQQLLEAAEEGRRLASLREDLVIAGVDPATLAVPVYPPALVAHDADCRYPRRPCVCDAMDSIIQP